jgi:hypothetical protein
MAREVTQRPSWTEAWTARASGAWQRLPHRWWWASGAGVLVVILLTWALWPSADEPPRERRYLDYTACLLTGDKGIADPAAAPVWAGMQEASLATHAKVQYLAVAGPQTTANAVPFINSLAQSRCDLIFTVGQAQVAAAEQGAPRFPAARFYAIGGTTTQGNLTAIANTTPDQVHTDVAHTITAAVPTGAP